MSRRLARATALAVLVAVAATGAILSDMDFAYVNNLHGASGDTLVGAVYLTSSDASVTFGYDNVAGAMPDTLDITAVGGGASGVLGGQDSLSFNRVMTAARDSLWSKHRAHGAFHNQFSQWDSINGTWKGVTGGGTDGNAVHVNQAGEFSGTPNQKAVPTASDYLLIEDAAASNGKAWVNSIDLTIHGKFSLTLEDPTTSEDFTIGYTNRAITVTEIEAVLVGSTPSLTFSLKHATSRTDAGTDIYASAAVTNTTTGASLSIADATVPAGSFIWLESTANLGTVDEINITIVYDED